MRGKRKLGVVMEHHASLAFFCVSEKSGGLVVAQDFCAEEERTCQVLRWGRHSEEEAVGQAEGRKEANEAHRLC